MVDAINIAVGGLQTSAAKASRHAEAIAQAGTREGVPTEGAPLPTDVVDLAPELVGLMGAKQTYAANAAVIRVASAMDQDLTRLLDERA